MTAIDSFLENARIALDPTLTREGWMDAKAADIDPFALLPAQVLEPAILERLAGLWPDFYSEETFREAFTSWAWPYSRKVQGANIRISPFDLFAMNPANEQMDLSAMETNDLVEYLRQEVFLTQNPMAPSFISSNQSDITLILILSAMTFRPISTMFLRYQDSFKDKKEGCRAVGSIFLEWCRSSSYKWLVTTGHKFEQIRTDGENTAKEDELIVKKIESFVASSLVRGEVDAFPVRVAQLFFYVTAFAKKSKVRALHSYLSGGIGSMFQADFCGGAFPEWDDFVPMYFALNREIERLAALVGDTTWQPLLRRIL